MYQKYWDWFLLDFGVQEWDHMSNPMKRFLKKLKIESVEGVRERKNAVTHDRIKVVISYNDINHIVDLISSNMEGYAYITFDFDKLDSVFGLKISKDDMEKIEKHFIDFFTQYLKDKIDYEFINKDEIKDSIEEIKIEKEKGFKVDEKERELLYAIVKEWYDDGFATWVHRGAPGEDGKFGGSFHYLEDNLTPLEDGFQFGIDFGSADDKRALYDLAHRVKDLGFEVDTGEHYNDIILRRKPTKVNHSSYNQFSNRFNNLN